MISRPILKNKIFLYITEFFAGMSVMAVELGASRLLAPYFSSSQIVWTIIIGTIMIAMALGNIYGGRAADKNPNPDRLYGRIIIAAIWIALIPVVGKYIIIGISAVLIFSVNSNFLIWAAFAACMVIFVFPLFLLGTVTPSLVKYSVDSLEDNGKTVGNLGAFNTIGSIIGTFLPTFVTIPTWGTSVTFLLFAAVLFILSAIYFLSAKVIAKKLFVGAAIILLCCIFGHTAAFAFWESDLLYEGESVYNYLQVKENDREVILSTNVLFGVQSMLVKDNSLTGMYYDYALASAYMAGIYQKDNLEVLILGNGSGTFSTQLQNHFANTTIEGVEIDEKITKLAYKYFQLPENVKVTTYDGRAYLQAVDKKYDLIMVDAYQDITIPFQMSTVEFFTMVKQHLYDDGVMVVNMNMRGTEKGSINQYLSDTIASVFHDVYIADVGSTTNRELFAGNSDFMRTFHKNCAFEQNKQLKQLMLKVEEGLSQYNAGTFIMTDDKAPVELLGMQVIDSLIGNEVQYYKEIYDQEGIQGLLKALQ